MLFYRYRPFSEVSLKELMYNEMYFSSPTECNDPFDSKTFNVFGPDVDKWRKVIELSVKSSALSLNIGFLEKISIHICKQCPLTFDEVLSRNLFANYEVVNEGERMILNIISDRLNALLNVYKPQVRYFVSYSSSNTEPLLWSHYADKHKGFCLIFRAIDGKIKQYQKKKKKSIRRTTPNSFSEQMSYGMPDDFMFKQISYENIVVPLDAFLLMPRYVTGDVKDDKEREDLYRKRESHYFQKAVNWKYENEYRLTLSPPMPWLFGEHFDYTQQERLFHYEPSQLVGIIYGARMNSIDRNRIAEIIDERKEWYMSSDYKRVIFDFVEFEAQLSNNHREVNVKPVALNSWKKILPGESDFERLYENWEKGQGLEMDGTSSKKVTIA